MRFNARRIAKQRDEVLVRLPIVLAKLTDDEVAELERRVRVDAAPDGFKSVQLGGNTSGGDTTDVTQAMALRRLDGRRDHDPQKVAIERIAAGVQQVADAVKDIDSAYTLIRHITDQRRGREVTLGSCLACLRDDVPNQGSDRIRSGYCNACYTAWVKTGGGQGRQDRHAFELSRRDAVANADQDA